MPDALPTPHPRRRALAELDQRIAEATASRAHCLVDIQAKPASEEAAYLASIGMLGVNEHLAMLRQSRAALMQVTETMRDGVEDRPRSRRSRKFSKVRQP